MRSRLLAFFDPNRSMALFVIGTAALTVAITALYDTVKELAGLLGAWLIAAIFFVAAIAVIIYQTIRHTSGRVTIQEEMKPQPRQGLILLVSPQRGTASAAIEYHLPNLKVCWLIGSEESLRTMRELYEEYKDRIREVRWGSSYVVDPDQVKDTYELIVRIVDTEVATVGLKIQDLIADITGGQKPMTAGMAIACLAKSVDMQYMKGKRDEQGEPDRTVPPEAIKIDTTFIPPSIAYQS